MSLPIQGVSIDWNKIDGDSYLRGVEAINGLDYLAFNKKITIFVGENGSGKSTMLEAIAVNYGFNPEGGTKNYSFSRYDSHSELCDAIKLGTCDNVVKNFTRYGCYHVYHCTTESGEQGIASVKGIRQRASVGDEIVYIRIVDHDLIYIDKRCDER